MTPITRRVLPVIALAAVATGGLVGSTTSSATVAHAAKTHRFKMTTQKFCSPYPACSSHGVNGSAVYKGTPLGSCTATVKLVIPKLYETWKCHVGSFKESSVASTGAADNSMGTWKITSGTGTGKLKHISGGGTFAGHVSTGIYTLTGTVNY